MIMMFLADGRWLVTGQRDATQRLARRVRQALEAADLAAYADLLDPAVRWGLTCVKSAHSRRDTLHDPRHPRIIRQPWPAARPGVTERAGG